MIKMILTADKMCCEYYASRSREAADFFMRLCASYDDVRQIYLALSIPLCLRQHRQRTKDKSGSENFESAYRNVSKKCRWTQHKIYGKMMASRGQAAGAANHQISDAD